MKQLIGQQNKILIPVAAVFLMVIIVFFFLNSHNYVSRCDRLDKDVTTVLKNSGITDKNLAESSVKLKDRGLTKIKQFSKAYKIDSAPDIDLLKNDLKYAAAKYGFSLAYGYRYEKKLKIILFTVNLKKIEIYRIILKRLIAKKEAAKIAKKAKVAIVIDDWGYNLKNIKAVCALKRPVTLAVLPNLPYSSKIATTAAENNCDVILHMPLEPHNNELPKEIDTIGTSMAPDEIDSLLKKSLDSVSTAKGISNHMGSKATEDEATMKIVFTYMNKNGNLYFLDSFCTNKSVCKNTAKRCGIKFAQRDIFLDNEADKDYIKGQLYKLADIAKKHGYAIGIGHDKALTVSVLKEYMPQLESDGIEFVYLSDLVK